MKTAMLHLCVVLCLFLDTAPVYALRDHPVVPNTLVYCPDTLTIYTSGGNMRYTASYNANAYTTKRLVQYYSGGQWVNYSLDSWTYTGVNYNSLDLQQLWSGGQWVNYSLDSSTFDAMGQMLVHLHKYWSQGKWIDSLFTVRTYDAHENMLTNGGKTWTGSQWQTLPGSTVYEYTYDPQGHVLTELYKFSTSGVLERATLTTYTYDPSGNMTSQLFQISANGIMTNWMISTYTYNAQGKLLTEWMKGWTNDAWMNGSLTTNTYDANGNLVNSLLQYWLNGFWTNEYQTVYTYDSHGNLLTGTNFIWAVTTWTAADHDFVIPFYDGTYFNFTGSQVTISYTALNVTDVSADAKSIVSEYSLSQNYPNPFNPSTNISFTIPTREFVSLRIFDLQGKAVATIVNEELPAGTHTRTWTAAGLSSGMYLYQMKAGTYTSTKRVLLLK